jgi:hypothetical protein
MVVTPAAALAGPAPTAAAAAAAAARAAPAVGMTPAAAERARAAATTEVRRNTAWLPWLAMVTDCWAAPLCVRRLALWVAESE